MQRKIPMVRGGYNIAGQIGREPYKMSRPNVQKILYKNVQLVWLS